MRHRHSMPFGAELAGEGVRFALWAPDALDVTLVLDGIEHDMPQEGGGWRRLVVSEGRAGSRYRYRTDGVTVPDPASRFQPDDVPGDSEVVDPTAFAWSDDSWRGRPWEEAVVYEAHVGTATAAGTFAALADELEDLVRLGVTVVELMPVNEFPGARNWGYDGVLLFAPDASYGGPDDLKRLVDRAHGLGLMVVLDVVYNHFGPAGNYLSQYAGRFFTERHQTPWGAGLNFDGSDGRPVREFFIHNALYWLEEFRLDGLRLDAVHAILDDSEPHIVAELAARVRAAHPDRHVHLVLENERNEARWLARDDGGRPLGHDAQWNDDIHHCWHTLITGERDAYYEDYADRPVDRLGRCLTEGFAYQGEPSLHAGGKPRGEPSGHLPPSAFIAFLQNHDQVGNRPFGDRLAGPPDRMALARAALLLSPQIPMLFMGEEWGATTPFQFFVDFLDDPALSDAVREGRRREFRGFPAFADPAAAATIPDPTAEATFARSVLDRSERAQPPHREVTDAVRALLALRHAEIVPLTKTPYLGASLDRPGPAVLDVRWRYGGGEIRFAAHLGEGTAEITTGADRMIWRSAQARSVDATLILAPWQGAVLVGAPR